MHGKVTTKMSNIRAYYWIPSLRKITKSIIKKCHDCVRCRAMPFSSPKPGSLLKQRTQEYHSLQVTEVDYAGPIYYRSKKKAISKSDTFLFLCSVSRTIHLEFVPNLTTQEFFKSLKGLIVRRGSPNLKMRRRCRLELSDLPEMIKTRSFTIF